MTPIAGNVYRIPRRFNWLLVGAGCAFLPLFLMAWRWGATPGDALAYFDVGLWLRDEIPLSQLRAPFAYRLGMPALAAFVPGELHHVFATLNWFCTGITACLATLTVRRLGLGTARALAAGLLVVLALPTAWYAPTVLVDPAAICLRMLFVCAVLSERPRLALAAGLAATMVSEENILLLAWLLATRRVAPAHGRAALAAAAAWLLLVHAWIVPGLPFWLPLPTLAAVSDWHGWLSLAGSAAFVLPLALAGLRHAPPRIEPLKRLLMLMAVPALWLALCTRVDGRVVWDLYPFLIPFAVAVGLPRAARHRPDVRALKIVRRA